MKQPPEPELPRRRTIVLDIKTGMSITWEPPLPDGPHRVNWIEAAGAAAVMGIGQALTGKGRQQIIQELRAFAQEDHKKGE